MKSFVKNKVLYFLGKYLFSSRIIIKLRGYVRLKRSINLTKPVYFNDKLNWLKLNWYDESAVLCADKYKVREYVAKHIGEQYLNELYGVYDDVDDINVDKLPNSFVLKSTHGTGEVLICKDKKTFNLDLSKKIMGKWLKRNVYWITREWVYKDIEPKIVCEKYLEDFETSDLKDYKIYCFNGVPKLIQVHLDRFDNHKKQLYDPEWNITSIKTNYNTDTNNTLAKPKQLDHLLNLSKKLSKNFPFVRVDFYIVNNKIIFGELTFFPGSGLIIFEDLKDEIKMGDWLQLPKTLQCDKEPK